MVSQALLCKFCENVEIERISPPIADESQILNQSMTTMLYLIGGALRNVRYLPVLYNSKVDGEDYDNMISKCTFYEGPLIFLVRHVTRDLKRKKLWELYPNFNKSQKVIEDTTKDLKESDLYKNYDLWGRPLMESREVDTEINEVRGEYGVEQTLNDSIYNIFGAYISGPLKKSSGWWGDENCFLFSLAPHLRIFYTCSEKKGQNFVTMNGNFDPRYKKGIGFGKQKCAKYRFYLDEDFKNSYITQDDDTYEAGWLTTSKTEKLKIDCVEILGAGDDLKIYENYLKKQSGNFEEERPKIIAPIPRPFATQN